MFVASLTLLNWMVTFSKAASSRSCLGLQLGEFCVCSSLNDEVSCEMTSHGFRGDRGFRPPSLNECNVGVFASSMPYPFDLRLHGHS